MSNTFDILLAQLQSSDLGLRSQAVLQLQPGQFNESSAIDALVDVLCTDSDLNVVEDATWVLARYGTSAIPALLRKIGHHEARVRHNIVHTLGKIADRQAVPALIATTHDPESKVRQKAAYVLGQIHDPQAIEALIANLDDPVQEVSLSAQEALGTFGSDALPQLIASLKVESAQVRELVANLLGDTADNRAVEPLIAAIKTDDWQVRFAIVEALGAIGDPHALPMLEQMGHDPQPAVRAMATEMLKQLRPSNHAH